MENTSIFSPELKEKLTATIGADQANTVENVISIHIISKARDFGTMIGNSLTKKLFSLLGVTNE